MNVKTFEEVRQRFLEDYFRRTIRFDCCCCEWRHYSGSDTESAFESGYAVAEIAFKGCRSKTIVRPAPIVGGNPVRGKKEKNIIGRGPGKNRNNLELCPTVVARCGGCCGEDFCCQWECRLLPV